MTPIQDGVVPMELFRLYWIGGGTSGEILDFAPDARTLEMTVEAKPSSFGIPCQHPIVGRARPVALKEATLHG